MILNAVIGQVKTMSFFYTFITIYETNIAYLKWLIIIINKNYLLF